MIVAEQNAGPKRPVRRESNGRLTGGRSVSFGVMTQLTRFDAGSFVRMNKHIDVRLGAMLNMLVGVHQGGGSLSSALKGAERELFVNSFLSQVFPPHFRFGSGDVIDSDERKSGQVDVVIDFPNLYSFPLFNDGPRLYLAVGVAAVLEIKSNVAKQWDQVLRTAEKVKSLSQFQMAYSRTLSVLRADCRLRAANSTRGLCPNWSLDMTTTK